VTGGFHANERVDSSETILVEIVLQLVEPRGRVRDLERVPIEDVSTFIQEANLMSLLSDVDANVIHTCTNLSIKVAERLSDDLYGNSTLWEIRV